MGVNSAVVMSEVEFRSRNNRDENSLSIANDRKCSFASVDMLIGNCKSRLPKIAHVLDGVGNRDEPERKTKKQKKVDFENDQARKKRLEEELKNIEPPSCGPRWKSCDESCCYTSSLGKSWHKFRAGVYFVAKHPYFEGFILFLIAASTVCLTLEDKNLNDGKNVALKVIIIYIIFFNQEKIIPKKFIFLYLGNTRLFGAYLRRSVHYGDGNEMGWLWSLGVLHVFLDCS